MVVRDRAFDKGGRGERWGSKRSLQKQKGKEERVVVAVLLHSRDFYYAGFAFTDISDCSPLSSGRRKLDDDVTIPTRRATSLSTTHNYENIFIYSPLAGLWLPRWFCRSRKLRRKLPWEFLLTR
jgi:hypothetical protein